MNEIISTCKVFIDFIEAINYDVTLLKASLQLNSFNKIVVTLSSQFNAYVIVPLTIKQNIKSVQFEFSKL